MRIYEDLRVVQAPPRGPAVPWSRRAGGLLVGLLLEPPGRPRPVLPRPGREQPHPGRCRIAAPRGPLLDRNGPRPRGEPALLQRGPHPRAQRRPRRRRWRGSAGSSGSGEAADPRAAGPARPPFRPVVVKTDASLEDVAALEARRLELPEVSVEVVPLRSYPAGLGGRPRPRAGWARSRTASSQTPRVRGPRAGGPRGAGRPRVAVQPQPHGPGRLPARDREQPRAWRWPRRSARAAGGRAEPHPHPRRRPAGGHGEGLRRAARAARWPSTRRRARSWP